MMLRVMVLRDLNFSSEVKSDFLNAFNFISQSLVIRIRLQRKVKKGERMVMTKTVKGVVMKVREKRK